MQDMPMAPDRAPAQYPVGLTIDYPDQGLDRGSTLLRLIVAIPILILLGTLGGHWNVTGSPGAGQTDQGFQMSVPGILTLPIVLMLLFRQKYPRWWFDWNVNLAAFSYRVGAYVCLLRDEYPATDDEQSVHLMIPYPNAQEDLNRWLPLVKWLLAIPHYVVLAFLGLATVVAVIIAWFAILITGGYPRGLFDFVVGVLRWSLRVGAYVGLLVTDRYPPFRLSE